MAFSRFICNIVFFLGANETKLADHRAAPRWQQSKLENQSNRATPQTNLQTISRGIPSRVLTERKNWFPIVDYTMLQ